MPIWVNPPYPGIQPRAEYHPGAKWLSENGRDPTMAKALEITNVAIFPFENKRMPWLLLHELAHAYHDQVLGFDHPEILAAYQRAKDSGSYEQVKRFTGKKFITDKAYALTNHKEYFAEATEAYFGKNDYFPFTREELKQHDPQIYRILEKVWGINKKTEVKSSSSKPAPPSSNLTWIKASSGIKCPTSIPRGAKTTVVIREAAYLLQMILAQRPDVLDAMAASGARLTVMAHNEFTTDVPEHTRMGKQKKW